MEPDPIEALTWREIQVLSLLNTRLSTKEIAAVLHVRPGTVNRHTRSIYRKLVVRTQREAITPEGEWLVESPP